MTHETALRWVRARNASPMTLDGTRTYLVGRDRIVVVDPGPADPQHIAEIERAAAGARVEAVLVTHGHPDHAAGAVALASRLDAPRRAYDDGSLRDDDAFDTDAGTLIAVHTPGHTRDHVCFHWRAADAVFVGDLLMGGQTTALVAPPEGDLGEYLASLERVRSLDARTLHPAHGPSFDDACAAIDAYLRHRADRERQVLAALRRGAADEDAIVAAVYGAALPDELRDAARGAVEAYLAHLEAGRRASRGDHGWHVHD